LPGPAIIILFAPFNLEPQTQQRFAIVAFMVVAWITQAMTMRLRASSGVFCSGVGVVRFPVAFSGLPTIRPGFSSARC